MQVSDGAERPGLRQRKAAATCAIQVEERIALELTGRCCHPAEQLPGFVDPDCPIEAANSRQFLEICRRLHVCVMRENTLPLSVANAVEKTRIRHRNQLYPVAKFVLGQINIHASAFTPDFGPQAQTMIVNQHLFARQVHAIPPVEKKPGLPGCDLVLHQSIGFFVIDDAEDRQQQVLVAVGTDPSY